MENFREFDKQQNQNWLKGVVALICLQKPLELFIDEEIEIFHRELGRECGPDHCVNECNFKNWKPRPNQSPPLECEVCSRWRDVIWPNHTSQRGKVMWLNSRPHLWSKEKWEVAKVYMPDGHKNHNSVGDFDIAALLCLMNQCKHFKKFELGGLCDKVANVRNKIMHAPRYQLEQKDMHDYFNRIRELGEVLARHDPKFRRLSEDINEIQNLDYRLILPDNIAAKKFLAQDEKELEDILFAVAQDASEHHLTRMKLEKLERQIAQLEQDNLADYYALNHKPRGLCVVINNEEFLGTELKNRKGTQNDAKALSTVFTRLGFDVMIHDNLTAGAMRRELEKLGSRNFMNEDALVVCVLTHGKKGCVFGTDENPLYLRELTQPFTSSGAPTLIGKPKLFFIQACQGSNYQRGIRCPPRPRQEIEPICLEEDAGSEDAGREDAGREDADRPGPMPCPQRPIQKEGNRESPLEEGADHEDAGHESAGHEDAGHESAGHEDAGLPGSVPCPPTPIQEEGNRKSPLEEDASPVHGKTVPWDADFLLGMATMPECKSFRNTSTGSIYIQELCRQLTRSGESLGKDDILTVLTRVNREVSRGDFLNYKQMPEPKYTLTKKLVLKFV